MMGGKFVFVLEVSVFDVLSQPVLGKVQVFLGDGDGHPGQGLEEGVMLLLVLLSTAGNSALEVQQVNISWVLTKSVHCIK